MLDRFLYLPIWIISTFIEQLSRLSRWFVRLLFGFADLDEEDDVDESQARRKSRRLKRTVAKVVRFSFVGAFFLTIAGGSVYLFFRGTGDYKIQLAERYQIALADAIENENPKEADLLRKKLTQLGVKSIAGEYLAALAIAQKGDLAEAYAKMQEIAKPDEPGYPRAHFWQAQHLIDGDLGLPPEESLPLALKHLGQLKTRTGKLAQVRYMEGIAFAKMGQVGEAINSLERASQEVPVANALLMELHRASGDEKKAKADAQAIQLVLSRKKLDGEKLSRSELRWQATAANLAGDPEAQSDAILQWYEASPDDPRAKECYARMQLKVVEDWLNEVDDRWLLDQEMPVESLSRAAKLMPDEKYDLVLRTLERIWKMRKSSGSVDNFFDALVSELNRSNEYPLPGKAIEFFGTSAAVESDWATADQLLEKATKSDPMWSHAWNNRAFVIGQGFALRIEEAISYSDKAIHLDPANAEFRETRGSLYLASRKWSLAVSDLELALNGVERRAQVHSALSKAYFELGNTRLGNLHRIEANSAMD